MTATSSAAVDLYWLPLGAGGRSVRTNGRVYEWLVARSEARPPRALYHSALCVRLADERFVIESAPVPAGPAGMRGVVAQGAVGTRGAGRLRLFRYEIRCWPGGVIPDVGEAVDSPRRLTSDRAVARRLLELAPATPVPVWGRDELSAGEMWNSNSVVSWLLESAGLDAGGIVPPLGGRVPGWSAGVVVAARTRERRVGAGHVRPAP